MLLVGSKTLDNGDHTTQVTANAEHEPTLLSSNGSGDSEDRITEVAWQEAALSKNDAEEIGRRDSLVQNLARTFTSESHAHRNGSVLTDQNDPTSPLNPNSLSFNARTWARTLADKVESSGTSFRTSGVWFQNMTSDYSAGTRHQKNVVNVWLGAVGLARQTFGHGKARVAILRDFNGVVRKGEMLVVLGPPGSGCTTFLKTLAGETNGLFVDEQTYFNYQGVTAGICTRNTVAMQFTPLKSTFTSQCSLWAKL